MNRIFTLLAMILTLTGCGGLFLYPDRHDYFPDVKKHVLLEEGFVASADGEKLHYWFIPAQRDKILEKKPKGLIVQVHGNAQNLTSHVRSLGWLTEVGYSLVAFDYRGYGRSTGKQSLGRAFKDVKTVLDHVSTKLNPAGLPLYFYGQSLGGTLLLKAVSSSPGRWNPKLVAIESSFYSYPSIAREKMASWWLSWPFQWLAYLLVPHRYSLKDKELRSISPTPVYMFYSDNDPIVPKHHGERIFKALQEPKAFFTYSERGHIAAMWVQQGKLRKELLNAMEKYK